MKVERRLPDNRTPARLNLHHLGEQLFAYISRWRVQIYLIYYLIWCTLYLILAQFTPLLGRGTISCIHFNSSCQNTPTHWFKWHSKPYQLDPSKSTNQRSQLHSFILGAWSYWLCRYISSSRQQRKPMYLILESVSGLYAILRGHVESLFSYHVLFQSDITPILKPTRGKGAKRFSFPQGHSVMNMYQKWIWNKYADKYRPPKNQSFNEFENDKSLTR